MGLDKYTTKMATDYANNEAEHHGYKTGSPQWKKAFKTYCEEATETMTAQNPTYMRNPSIASAKPFFSEIFTAKGAAGEIAKNYNGEAMTTEAVEQRIMAAVTNLVKLFENGKMNRKTRARGKYGKMQNSEMTDMQLPKRPEGMSDSEWQKIELNILRNWLERDLLTGFLLESLIPFFAMTKNEVQQMATVLVETGSLGKSVKEYQSGGAESPRSTLFKNFAGLITPVMSKINYYRMILKP